MLMAQWGPSPWTNGEPLRPGPPLEELIQCSLGESVIHR